MRFAGTEKIFANEIKQRRVVFRHFSRPLQRANASFSLIVVDEQKALVDKLLKSDALLPVITRQNLQPQLFATLALELLFSIFLTSIDPEFLQPVAFDRSVVSQQTDQGFHERAIEMRVLRLSKQQVEALF